LGCRVYSSWVLQGPWYLQHKCSWPWYYLLAFSSPFGFHLERCLFLRNLQSTPLGDSCYCDQGFFNSLHVVWYGYWTWPCVYHNPWLPKCGKIGRELCVQPLNSPHFFQNAITVYITISNVFPLLKLIGYFVFCI
jgi:hypothetical protein